MESFALLINPLAPHFAQEVWSLLGKKDLVALQKWPQYQEEFTTATSMTIGVQVNGKLRGTIEVSADSNEEEYRQKSLAHANVKQFTEGKKITKHIVVKSKIVNIVVAD